MTPFDAACLLGSLLGLVFGAAAGMAIALGTSRFDEDVVSTRNVLIPGWLEARALDGFVNGFRKGYPQASRTLRGMFLGGFMLAAISLAAWLVLS